MYTICKSLYLLYMSLSDTLFFRDQQYHTKFCRLARSWYYNLVITNRRCQRCTIYSWTPTIRTSVSRENKESTYVKRRASHITRTLHQPVLSKNKQNLTMSHIFRYILSLQNILSYILSIHFS